VLFKGTPNARIAKATETGELRDRDGFSKPHQRHKPLKDEVMTDDMRQR
jgi:hypothetical protein